MFKNHPKGLIVAFFSNMGERFGFYTMMAILVLFLQARFGLSAQNAGSYYSWFYLGIYALALVGGMIADATSRYKLVIGVGIVIMFSGYVLMSVPGMSLTFTLLGLFIIAFGNGLFKGNLQAVVGQMYDDPKYSKVRDTAFMIFYMGINMGAFFAPFAATGVRNWFLKTQGFAHDGSLPAMCHAFLRGEMTDPAAVGSLEALAGRVSNGAVSGTEQLTSFATSYLAAFSRGYNYAFGVAAAAMVVSLIVYIVFNRHLPNKTKKQPAPGAQKTQFFTAGNLVSIVVAVLIIAVVAAGFNLVFKNLLSGIVLGLFVAFAFMMLRISTKEERPRVISLIMVFIVVIFFWMSFHQNGLTLTFFARDYTVKEVGPFTNIFFNLRSMLVFIATLSGLVLFFARKKLAEKAISLAAFAVFGWLTWLFVSGYDKVNPIAPEIFQSFNPLFIVALTFPVMALFTRLRNRNSEPSTPRKIGIGMIIASIGFLFVLIGSLSLISPKTAAAQGLVDWGRVSPYWLISTYLVLTVAELFLSPMGLSFVSKVAPGRFQGIMQGGWLLATGTGNGLLFIGSYFWDKIELWQLWAIFIVCCIVSAVFIFSIMKRLEQATS
jgi:POT family proton-dependent oligopeptide transporter